MNSLYAPKVNEIHANLQELERPLDGAPILQLNHTGTKKTTVASGARSVEVITIDRVSRYYVLRDAWRDSVKQRCAELMEILEGGGA